MRLLSILCFIGGVVLLALTVTNALTRGWGPLDLSVFDVYLVVLPRYLLLTAAGLLIIGFVSAAVPHP